MPPVVIDTRAGALIFPNGQTARYEKIAIPPKVRAIRSRRAYGLWHTTREMQYRMPVDCGLAERNSTYLYSTTDLSRAQCRRMGAVMAAYLVEVIL